MALKWIKTALGAVGRVLLVVIALIAVVIGAVLGPPVFDASNIVRAAERAGRIDARSWRETLPPRVGAALVAAEFSRAPAGGRTVVAMILANRLAHDHRRTAVRGNITRAMVAAMLDSKYWQDQLIDDYARQAYFGRDAFGVDQAARAWFAKSPAALNVQEAAFLALLLRGPGNYDPARGAERAARAKGRRDYVLRRMRELGYIDDVELAAARASPLGVIDAPSESAP